MKVAILGGTKGMGRSLARALAERGDQLYLLGRDSDDMQRSASDLVVHGMNQHEVDCGLCDLSEPQNFGAALDAAIESLGELDLVIVTAAIFAEQAELEADTERARQMLVVNFANTVAFCEEARKRLLASGGGTLCVFSSVAGDRGRKPVAIYGASKAGLSAYLEALDHKFRSEGLVTICVKPGFVKTGMTAGLDPPPFAGEPDQVAAIVVKAIDKGTPVVYAPGIWRFVMLAIKNLPRFVMRRINF